MGKTLADYIGKRPVSPQQTKIFNLEDVFENDPHTYCPSCNSTTIERLRTHNSDGADYECRRCSFRYELNYMPD